MADKYFTDWPESTSIGWQNEGRKKLNAIILLVNQWTLDGCEAAASTAVLRHIDMGLQTFATRDGGSGWAEALEEMKAYIKEKVGTEDD